MTSTAPSPAGDDVDVVRPGYCSVHPNQRLVSHRQAGIQWWGSDDPKTVCVMPHDELGAHELGARERCRYCGGPLVEPGTPSWQVSPRRAFCSPNHRLRAFRGSKR
jgi:hypothetical protein